MQEEIRRDEVSEASAEPVHPEPVSPEVLSPSVQTEVSRELNPDKPRVMRIVAVFGISILIVGLVGLFATGKLELPGKKAVVTENPIPGDNGIGDGSTTILPDKDADSGEKLFNLKLSKPAFAAAMSSPASVTPAVPLLRPASTELVNLEAFIDSGVMISDAQLAALEEAGFYLDDTDHVGTQQSGNDDFSDSYGVFAGNSNKYYREPQDSVYISSDVALHLYHILIDRSFQKIEEEKFYPMLRDMMETLFTDSIELYNNSDDPVMQDSAKRLAAFYYIPLTVLDSAAGKKTVELDPSDFETYAAYREAEAKQLEAAGRSELIFTPAPKSWGKYAIPDDIYQVASEELDLIQKATGVTESPLFTPYRTYFNNDYSQFKPRSHYTKNDYLKSYFIAMMWLGRMGFSLDSPELTRDALLISGQVNKLTDMEGNKVADMYSTMSVAIEFFVGEVDDLTPYEYTGLMRDVYGEVLSSEEFDNDAMLSEFISQAIEKLPMPRIVSESVDLYDNGGERDELLRKLMQFRFMGQRFTPDAYVLNNLTQGVGAPDPETGQKLPSMTTALMPVYVISGGNKTVKTYIDGWVEANAPDSDLIIDKKLGDMLGEFSAFPESTWTQNIYWSWLDTYRTLLGGYSSGYPYFMTTEAWQKKNLGTVLGSYTELKHDTLLYAKQSYAELGGGGNDPDELPPVPKGYVEADYAFWSRISSLAELTSDGLTEQGLMPEYFSSRYAKFVELVDFYRDIAEKELGNETITEEEFETLRVSPKSFDAITSALPGEELTDKERRAGIIADIHTDAVDGKILYEATGKPYIIFVAVKDANGARLTRGLVYNHYELIGPLTERYADEDWQARVYDEEGSLPAADEWSLELIK